MPSTKGKPKNEGLTEYKHTTMEDKKWIDDVMNSLEGSSKAQPSDAVWQAVQDNLNAEKEEVKNIPQLRLAVAAAIVFFILNTLVLQQELHLNTSQPAQQESQEQPVSVSTNFYLY
ncbi:MAG: hypothetical protein CL843_00545 [Crocinitomicaceae bacterium]|nr:hypothetical protein [Crocinitomicaceae bacterium]